MDEIKIELEQLANHWKSLHHDIKTAGKLDFDVFADTFSNTYRLLCQTTSQPSVERKLLPIIMNAYLFAHADVSEHIDAKYKASLVFTERMLRSVMDGSGGDTSTVYILELREEIRINFNDVTGSVASLARKFEIGYWNKINM